MRLIDADALMKTICGKECGQHFEECHLEDDNADTRCVFRDYVQSAPTIEPEVRLIPKEVSATDIDKLTEMIKGSLLQAYPNDAMFTAVRHGRWMFHEQKNGYLWKCSNCKGNFDQRFAYCPHCGAKMDEGGADNETNRR